ncbi:hypothetical protein [Vreelandella sp. GE22]
MENKYKIHFLRINLLLAAAALACWSVNAPVMAATALWASALWLALTALLLDFTLRRSRDVYWQLFTSGLLLCLIAAAPERHSMLIWVWAALFMLPQSRRRTFGNVAGALISWLLIAPSTPSPQAVMLLLALCGLSLLAFAQSRWLINVNGTIRQRLRLIPGLNLWAGEQLLKDLNREQIRAERENIYAEVLIIHVKRKKLWSSAQRLCELIHGFENVYHLSSSCLAVLLLCHDRDAGARRRHGLCRALSSSVIYHHLPLDQLDITTVTLDSLSQRSLSQHSAFEETSA